MANFDDLFQQPARQPERQAQADFDVAAWAAQKKEQRDAVYAMIDEYTDAMRRDGGLYKTYLDVQARFDRYSVSNAILIAKQMPSATRLADFDTWKAGGVHVNRGADAITVLEPGKEYTREKDGSTGVYYNPRKVFDISQTNSRQPQETTVSRDERLLLKALMNNAPCRFAVADDLPERVNAAYVPNENVVRVRRGLDAPDIFRGLAQALARAHIERGGYACSHPAFAAYSVSYLLCKRNGIPADGYTFARMPESFLDMDAQTFRAEAGTVRRIANEISGDMNRLLNVQEKAPKSRDDGAR